MLRRENGERHDLENRLRDHFGREIDPAWERAVRDRVWARASRARLAAPLGVHRLTRGRLVRPFLLFMAVVACATGVALAVSSVVNLGKPTDAVPNGYFRLGGFHRATGVPQSHPPRLLFIGTQDPVDHRSAVERWPVVKALEQFGFFTNLRPLERQCVVPKYNTVKICSPPSFDWSRASYRSKYLTFSHKDLLNARGRPFQTLSSVERRLYNRYARAPGTAVHDPDNVKASVGAIGTTHTLPLVAVGGYEQTLSQVLNEGDFEENINVWDGPPGPSTVGYATPSGLSFDTVRSLLATEKDRTFSNLNFDVNAEANVISAFICHADGMKPASVCRRPVITRLLKLVK